MGSLGEIGRSGPERSTGAQCKRWKKQALYDPLQYTERRGRKEREGGRGVAVIVNRVFFSQVTAEPEAVVDQVAGAFSGSSLVTTAAAMTRRGGKKKE